MSKLQDVLSEDDCMFNVEASLALVLRLNVVGLTLTAVSTIAIELLKDKEWQTWFQSQPFRVSRFSNDGTWFNKLMQPTPHRSEAYMMSKSMRPLVKSRETEHV